MLKRISKLFDVSVPDPEDARRRKLLNVLLVYVGACAFLCAILLIVIPSVLINDGGQAAWGLVLSVVVIIMVPVLYTLNRRASGRSAQWLFVFFLLIVILLIYDPGQNLRGRGLLLFSLPIFLSSLLLRSWASFPMAAFSGLALAGLSYQTGRPLPSLLSFVDFFFLASVAWLSARGLERAAKGAGLADDKLQMSENRFRGAMDGLMEGCQIIGFDWKYRYVNDSAAKHGQRPKNELLGRTMMEAYPGIEQTEMFAALRKCMDRREPQRMVNEFIYPDGSKALFELGIQPVPEGIFILSLDITARQRAEEALASSEQFLNNVIEQSPVSLWISDSEGTLIKMNQACRELFGITDEEAVGKYNLLQDNLIEAQGFMALVGDVFEKGEIARFTIDYDLPRVEHIKVKEGTHRILDVVLSPIKDIHGKLTNVLVQHKDITESKRAEEALQKSENRLRETQGLAHLGFWTWDVKTGAVEWSEEVFKIFCLDPKEFTPQIDSILTLSPWPEDHQRDQELIQRAIETRSPGSYEQKFLRPDKSIGHYYSTFQGNYDEKGELISIVGTVLDITERKQAEEKIALLAKFPSENPNPVLRLARNGTVLYANNASKTLLDEWGSAIGRPAPRYWQEIAAESLEKKANNVVEAQSGGRTYSFFVTPIVGEDYVNLYGRDESERKRAEEALRESEDKFKYVFDNSVVGKSITLLSGEMHANKALCEMLGYPPEELQSKRWQEITHPDDIELTQKEVDALLSGEKEAARFTKRYLHRNGSVIWGDVSTSLRRDEQGKPLYLMTTLVDITEHKRVEEALGVSEEKYRLIADNADDWIYLTAPDRTILYTSPSCERVTGYTPKEFTDDSELIIKIVHPDDREDFESHFMEAQEKSRVHNKEFRILTKSGETRWISHSCVPVHTEEGQYGGRRGTNRDITDRKRAEDALKNTLADLERSNADLEQFAYVASHDLQEPLRMVSSYTQLLARRYKGKLDKDADEFIAYAVDGADNMQRLINDLLSYSRVGTRGKPPEAVPSDAALDRALDNLKMAIEENRAEIEREPLPTVTADDVQLTQVFQNLVGNAIKFHGDHPPRIRVACEARGNEWIFSVRDNGIGIDPQYLDRIFIIFQRLHKRGQYPGTGIGLAMCKKIIVRHGGRIWVESEPGKGSTFFFSLPKTGG